MPTLQFSVPYDSAVDSPITTVAATVSYACATCLIPNDTNKLELRVFGNDGYHHAVLIARLDNLGKGASGAAVQNLKLMLGL